jgi:hypothetical protein
MKTKKLKKTTSISVFAVCAAISSCATSTYQEPPRVIYSEGQIAEWKSYLAISPFSNEVTPRSSVVRSKVNSYLPDSHNDHIRSVADHIDNSALAQKRYAAETSRITGNYEVAKFVAPDLGAGVYRLARDNRKQWSFGDMFGSLFSSWVAQGYVDSRYRSEMENAATTIMSPVIENGKRLVLAEDALTRGMQVAPSFRLSQKVQSIEDDHYRNLLPGVWKETALVLWTPKVWLFSSNGSYQWENPITSNTESGRWSINNQILNLQSRFGVTQYRLVQEGKNVTLVRLSDNSRSKLEFVSGDSSDYRNLLRSLKGNVRFDVRF